MGDHDQGAAGPAQKGQRRGGIVRIERRRRLVGQDDRRIEGQRGGDIGPGEHAAGQLVRISVQNSSVEIEHAEQLVDPIPVDFTPVGDPGFGNVLADAPRRGKGVIRILGDEADQLAQRLPRNARSGKIVFELAGKADASAHAGGGRQKPEQRPEKCRLAGARRPEQGDGFTACDGQADAVQYLHLLIGNAQIAYAEAISHERASGKSRLRSASPSRLAPRTDKKIIAAGQISNQGAMVNTKRESASIAPHSAFGTATPSPR